MNVLVLDKVKNELIEGLREEYKTVSREMYQEDLLDTASEELEYIYNTLLRLIEQEKLSLLVVKQLSEKYVLLDNLYDTAKYVFNMNLTINDIDDTIVKKSINYLNEKS